LSAEEWAKLGAYDSPFSGTGVEFLPLGTKSEEAEITLHEIGYLPERPHWNYSKIFSPFWRLARFAFAIAHPGGAAAQITMA
jgi:hypothetical protein